MKHGFWESYHTNLNNEISRAEKEGVAVSKVKEFYQTKVTEEIKYTDLDGEEFYQKVKKLLTEEGEVSNAIGRLTDTDYYRSLTYEEQQTYNLRLSERYLKAVARYKKEKEIAYRG